MRSIHFSIIGNQEDKTGNPIPYMRSTQGGQWKPNVMRYNQWKGHIVASYLDALGEIKKIDRADFGEMHDLIQRKPIKASKEKIYMNIMITFKDKTHADGDNIFKGVADALFMNDKYVAGSFDYQYGDVGRIDVEIIWQQK